MQKLDLEDVWRCHSRAVLATLIRLLGDFDLAEDALHDAFAAAAQDWPRLGRPRNPVAWLVSAGRFKAIDKLRKAGRLKALQTELSHLAAIDEEGPEERADMILPDDQLRLIFTCCHPALGKDAQVALTLREVCGLTTEEVARSFLARPATIAQRIVRAKSRIRELKLPYEVPGPEALPARLTAVLRVVYLVFNEGYAANAGPDLLRPVLSAEAIRLGRLIAELMPDAETWGLLGLMLIHEARRDARTGPDGDPVLLKDQDRSKWDANLVDEGTGLVARAFATKEVGPFAIQGAIAAEHVSARTADATDWRRISHLYEMLSQAAPSPVVALNHAVAISMADGPQAGLDALDRIDRADRLEGYHPLHVARGDMFRRLGRLRDAAASYRTALELCRLEPAKRVLAREIAALDADLALLETSPAETGEPPVSDPARTGDKT